MRRKIKLAENKLTVVWVENGATYCIHSNTAFKETKLNEAWVMIISIDKYKNTGIYTCNMTHENTSQKNNNTEKKKNKSAGSSEETMSENSEAKTTGHNL